MSLSLTEQELIGKTIKSATIQKLPAETGDYKFGKIYDDEPILQLEMTDGTTFEVISTFGGYTGNSEDEYPRFISVHKKGVVAP